jgi:hypothetical protein
MERYRELRVEREVDETGQADQGKIRDNQFNSITCW